MQFLSHIPDFSSFISLYNYKYYNTYILLNMFNIINFTISLDLISSQLKNRVQKEYSFRTLSFSSDLLFLDFQHSICVPQKAGINFLPNT